MRLRKLITLEDFGEIKSEKDVLELLREIHRKISTYEDSRFMEKSLEEILEMIKKGNYKNTSSNGNVFYEINFSEARKTLENYRWDLSWEDIVRVVSKERK